MQRERRQEEHHHHRECFQAGKVEKGSSLCEPTDAPPRTFASRAAQGTKVVDSLLLVNTWTYTHQRV